MSKQVTCRWTESWRTRRATRRTQCASSATSPDTRCRDIAGTKTASSSTRLPLDHVRSLMAIASASRQRPGDPGKHVIEWSFYGKAKCRYHLSLSAASNKTALYKKDVLSQSDRIIHSIRHSHYIALFIVQSGPIKSKSLWLLWLFWYFRDACRFLHEILCNC